MITCPSCSTLNSEGETLCLVCRAPLDGGRPASQTMVEGQGHTCPNGHPIDPSWKSCPYCTRGSRAAPGEPHKAATVAETGEGPGQPGAALRTTRLETDSDQGGGAGRRTRLAGEPAPEAQPPGSPASRHRETRLEKEGAAPKRTVLRPAGTVEPPPAAPPPPGAASEASVAGGPAEARRELVAVLAAPSLRPGGVVFPVRTGKNTVGADPASDVCLAEDPQVSGEHALLLHRGDVFYLADRMSTNGTEVNGEELAGTDARVVKDRDRLRCGATELVLLVLDPDRGQAGSSPEADPGPSQTVNPPREPEESNP